ncbi:Surfactin synthase thioesterase subunit [Streptomyces sp. WMMB 714]|uniref:thioesterase II family protein n=1 Tax=Streptomyces sp. WMMB 714 TaxID=1286822 RepID=UPI000823850D|nr:alpha/beta fold hydrolase [Streptomyces sp. WMMB 714]SCK28975.1 Surfactin synthase thioesterase subunit [Streptomyces sp. WMMB 714]
MTRYLPRTTEDGSARDGVRLLCFPYAGGGASAYGRWQRGLDAHGAGVHVLPVQLPGREGRVNEERFTALKALVDDLDEQLDDVLSRPHVFYGHSMGALIACTLTLRRQQRGAPLPLALVLGAYRAPHLPAPTVIGPEADDGQLARRLIELGGIPEALTKYPDFLRALLPVARDDLLMCRDSEVSTYGRLLQVPLHLFAGRRDRLVSVPEVAAWRLHAGRGSELRTMPGGHFFLRDDEPLFLGELSAVLRRYAQSVACAGAPV